MSGAGHAGGERTRDASLATRQVVSVSNPAVKDIRALAMRKERERTGLFVAEGLKLVADAMALDWPPATLVHALSVESQPMVRRTVAAARARGALVLAVSEAVLQKIARRDNPQTVIGVFAQRWRDLAPLDPAAQTVLVALEGVRDPGNLGTILRTVDAVGGSGAILVGETTDPFSPEAVRASMGSIFHVPLFRATPDEFAAFVARTAIPVVATHLSGKVDYRAFAWREPAILLMGNEKSGLPDDLAALADALVRIPMPGRADSLNLAVATAIVLYEARRTCLPTGAL